MIPGRLFPANPPANSPPLLILNGGSSSIKFCVYPGPAMDHPWRGTVNSSANFPSAAEALLDDLEARGVFASLAGVGHRIVQGMSHSEPELVTSALLAELRSFQDFDPDHLPGEIALIEAVGRRHPRLPQVACFDTAFHHGLPRVAAMLPIPRRYWEKGVRRYGFHGLSYTYLLEELDRLDPGATQGRVILAHLGSGASLAAVQGGKCLDTSMGFTPASGMPMGTRSGDIDPGLAAYLEKTEGLDADRFQGLANRESGLLGISETSADMRELLAREADDVRAAEAVALFCYQAKKWIGAYAAALGGLDTLVFSGGIGENAPAIRTRICAGLEFLGIALDNQGNAAQAPVISVPGGRVTVRVIPTDEELMMARSVRHILKIGEPMEKYL